MIRLDYELSPDWNRSATGAELQCADETALRYDCFLGDVVLILDGTDFSAQWGWVPVLDFALGLRAVADGLDNGVKELFEFTESDAAIVFRRQDDMIRVEVDYAGLAAEVSYVDFSLAVERFLARVVADLVNTCTELASNPFIVGLRGRAGGPRRGV